jgi:hypothetical protein
MKKLFINIKNIFKYAKKELMYTWIFFLFLGLASKSPHNFFENLILSGLMTLSMVIIAAIMKTLKLL